MKAYLALATWLALASGGSSGCAPTPKYIEADCPVYTDIEEVRVNPAGALDRRLRVRAAFKVCPPEEGLVEIKRKRIELRHELIALLSSMTREELEHPRRIENVRQAIVAHVNERLMRKGSVIDVSITGFELE